MVYIGTISRFVILIIKVVNLFKYNLSKKMEYMIEYKQI